MNLVHLSFSGLLVFISGWIGYMRQGRWKRVSFQEQSDVPSVNFIYALKNLLLALFIFAMVSFFSLFISALILKFHFLLLTLGFSISSFSSCFICRVRLFIWLFSCFLRYACIDMNFPLITAFIVSHRFWVVVFSFSFVSMHILRSFLMSSVICWLFWGVLFSLHMLEFLIGFSCNWDLILLHCVQKRCLEWF